MTDKSLKSFLIDNRQQVIGGGCILLFFAIILSPVVTIEGWLMVEGIRERRNRIAFESEKWKDESLNRGEDAIRIRMVDDLLQRYDLKGMTRSQVVEMLGEPGQTGYFRDWDLVYWLGPERSFISIDSEWLVIRMNERKEVSDFKIERD